MDASDTPTSPPAGVPNASQGNVPAFMEAIRERTPARILTGRAGTSYRTVTQLQLRCDQAFAADAVHAELDLPSDFGRDFVERWQLFEVSTNARSKSEYLLRPDLGRRLNDDARRDLTCQRRLGADLQVVIGDGLSVAAVTAQVPALLPLLEQGARQKGWTFGRPFVVHYCRVSVLNDIGELLDPAVAVLLIGERPGLATAESLSAYVAYRPRPGHTDAQRNLISNIHTRGVSPDAAAWRILALAEKMRRMHASGVLVKEDLVDLTKVETAPQQPSAGCGHHSDG